MVGCDLQRILAGAVFRHRCRSKGLRLRSPARRLARPLASATVGAFASAGLGEFRRSGGEQVLRLRARDGAFRAPARVTFFCCQKKVTKENHSNLRFKDPLARGGFRRCGGESVFPWRGGGLRRPHFFLRRKKCGKESRLDLRSKNPLARCGLCRFGGMHSRMKCGG